MAKLIAKDIGISYGGKETIKDISIEISQGEIVSLIGVSGVGKTTLFNILSGILVPDQGSVLLDNVDITGEAGHISYMLQKDLLLPYKTVLDNVILPLTIRGEDRSSSKIRGKKYFKTFGIDGTENKYPHQLSGGMRQRAAFLRTYLFSQDVALLDEPFSALDTITKGNMHSWYLDIMEKIKLSTLFITHDIDEAILLSDRIYIMAGQPGMIVEEIKIHKKRPRGEEFLLNPEFIQYKKQILDILNS